MFRLTQTVYPVIKTLKAPVRLLSTGQDAALCQDAPPAGLEWDSALPYSEMPGPRPRPVIGNIMRFLPGGEFYKQETSRIFDILRETYGPVSKLSGILGKPDFVCVFDAVEVARVFRSEGPLPIRGGADSLDYYFRNMRKHCPPSLIISQGPEWQTFRSAVNQVMMQPRNTLQYVRPIDRVSQEFVDRMRVIRNDKLEMPPDFSHEISKWALESITLVALDARLGLLKQPDPEASQMIKAVRCMFDSMYELDVLPSPWKLISTPAYRRFVSSIDFVTQLSTKHVNKAMERLSRLPADEERDFSVLENLLIRTRDPQRAVTMALDMLLAGIDTTATVVSMVAYQLANNPEKQLRLHEEVDRLLPNPTATLEKHQLKDMRYLRACIKETMRLMPIALGLVRTTVKDMVIGGYQVPKGTLTCMVTHQLSVSEAYFPRADEFLPERWLPGGDHIKCRHPYAFLPFGFGPRSCVGQRLADLEIEILLAKVFRNFSMEWNRPPAKTKFRMLFSFDDPLTFTVKDRI